MKLFPLKTSHLESLSHLINSLNLKINPFARFPAQSVFDIAAKLISCSAHVGLSLVHDTPANGISSKNFRDFKLWLLNNYRPGSYYRYL